MKKIVICGGHLTPALALIEEFQSKKDIQLSFLGRKFSTEGSKNLSAEYQSITKLPVKFYSLTAGRLQRKFTKFTIPALLKIPIGFIQSFIYLIIIRPNLVISFGGYLSLPVVFSAWLLGIRSITHEQSITLGLANKINSLFVKKTYLSWNKSAEQLNTANYKVIGNLTRTLVLKKEASDQKINEFLKNKKKIIFVTGGNQGSHFLNQMVFSLMPELKDYAIFHQVGTANFKGDLDHSKGIKEENYFAQSYLDSKNIGAVFQRADLVISRSGANTVWDLAILAKVSILIPLPIAAAGEQEANAKILERAKSAILLDQKATSSQVLKQKIDYIFRSLPKFQKNAQAFSKTLPKNATQILTSQILKLIES